MQNCGQVFRYAVATGRAERDPTGDLRGALPPVKEKHHASIKDPKAIGALLRAIDGYQGSLITKCALRLAPLLFVRPGELMTEIETPDLSEMLQIALDGAEDPGTGYAEIPLALTIDGTGRIAVAAEIDFAPVTDVLGPDLAEASLDFGYDGVAPALDDLLQLRVPAGMQVASGGTSVELVGRFDGTEVVRGPRYDRAPPGSVALPGGAAVLVEVEANDGFHTARDRSDAPFSVGEKPPLWASITTPAEGERLVQSQRVFLAGAGYDLEDGVLPGSAVFASGRRTKHDVSKYCSTVCGAFSFGSQT